MTKRAQKLIRETYGANCPPAIAALVEFAAQNSGIQTENYFNREDLIRGRRDEYNDGVRSYRSEVRDIGNDWRRFKEALTVASIEGVTDQDVIKASSSAYSGRLEWKERPTSEDCGVWSYCTGQYFPTEYRKAAATVIEDATRTVRRARPPQALKVTTIAELKALNERNGGYWFEPASMRFFGTRIESGIIRGCYFVTSEQREDNTPRLFTLRSFDETGDIATVGEFHSHKSKRAALDSIPTDTEKAA